MKHLKKCPLLSIVIPTFNRADAVVRLIQSIGHKNDDSLEIVIVDDNSSPKYFNRLKTFCTEYSNITLYRNKENLGMVKNWNKCIDKANGEWICFMCDDDLFRPNGVDRILELISEKHAAYLILQLQENENEINFYNSGVETVKNLKLPLVSGNVWHRKITNQLGGFDERIKYSPDAEFWYRVAYNFPVITVKQPFATYVSHENNYAYETWGATDFLEQVALICKINAKYFYGENTVAPECLLDEINRAKDETIATILTTTCMAKNKRNLFCKYYRIGLERQKGFGLSFRFFIINIFLKKIISDLKAYIKKCLENYLIRSPNL